MRWDSGDAGTAFETAGSGFRLGVNQGRFVFALRAEEGSGERSRLFAARDGVELRLEHGRWCVARRD